METVLEEEAESPAVAQPSNGLIPPVIEEDQNGPMQDNFMDNGFMDEGFMDEVFDHENAWPAKYAPSDPTLPAKSFPDRDLADLIFAVNGF